MEKTFLLYLSVNWGNLIKQIKKICRIHFNTWPQGKQTVLFFQDPHCFLTQSQGEHLFNIFVFRGPLGKILFK